MNTLPTATAITRALDNLPPVPATLVGDSKEQTRPGCTSQPGAALPWACRLIRDDQAVILRDGTRGAAIGWLVLAGGYVHGGRHHDAGEALEHWIRCYAWTATERAEWIAHHEALGVEAAA